MKIKRYSAPDMRAALRAVQQEQGPDAVILSSHETADGIELVAAVDYDESLIHQARAPATAATTVSERPAFNDMAAAAPAVSYRDDAMRALEERMQGMQQMLQDRLDKVTSGCQSSCPGQQIAHSLLSRMGLGSGLVDRLVAGLETGLSTSVAVRMALKAMAQKLPVMPQDIAQDGGAIALLGPTGVGKTTTAAKLAARHILRFGQGSVQFVGTDEYRIGAQEQLAAYGRILGAPLHRIQAADELADILQSRQPQELILVDTAGVGGRDLSLHQQFDCLAGQRNLHRALCLPAATAPQDLRLQARRFAATRPDCLILTKLDETRQLGSALGFVMAQGLPLAYTTDGQQVPEDLHCAVAHELVYRAHNQLDNVQEEHRACA